MHLNENILLSNLNNLKCFENKPSIAVGVSGGPDSMALIYILSKWIKFKKGKLFALVFDHGIRGDSYKEAKFVNSILKNLNINSFIIKVSKNHAIKKNMAQARANRFKGLINFCNNKKILHLFLGHHHDDNLETYLIRKINGSNFDGLASMNTISYFNGIQILRPLININKISILKFNKENQVSFINDPSNKDINYTRVKVRNFLKNKYYKKLIQKDFINLKKKIPDYRKMIWELFIEILNEVKPFKIKIRLDKLCELDDLIIEKHIMLVLNFFLHKKNQIKSSKIKVFIDEIKKPSFKKFNLSGILIQKKTDLLIFYQK